MTNFFEHKIKDYYTVIRNYNNSFCTLTPKYHYGPTGYGVV